MFLIPSTIFRSLAVGAILVVLVSVLAALTLLPAVLSLLGDRIDALRLPFLRTGGSEDKGFWAGRCASRDAAPVVSLVAGVAVLLAAAVPFAEHQHRLRRRRDAAGQLRVEARLRDPRRGVRYGGRCRPRSSSTAPIDSPAVQGGIEQLEDVASPATRPSAGASWSSTTPAISRGHDASCSPGTNPRAEADRRRPTLRDDTSPGLRRRTWPRCSSAARHGRERRLLRDHRPTTCRSCSPSSSASRSSCSLVAFRSLVVPAKAILMNLLSVGAAYGLLVLVFQEGIGAASSASSRSNDRGLAAALPLLGALRPLDGLPRLPAQPHPRALRPDRRQHRRGRGRAAGRPRGSSPARR